MLRKPKFETLENKRLLAADMTAAYDAASNTLTVRGDGTANSLSVFAAPSGDIQLAPINGSEIEGDTSAPRGANLDIRLLKGDDSVDIDDSGCAACAGNFAGSIQFRGGLGDDVVHVSQVSASSIFIGTNGGADTVSLGLEQGASGPVAAADVNIMTGAENDTISVFSLEVGNAEITTGAGFDNVRINAAQPVPSANATRLAISTGAGGDNVEVEAIHVGGEFNIATGTGRDDLNVEGTQANPITAGDLLIDTKADDDEVRLSGFVTVQNDFVVKTGNGDDEVRFGSASSEGLRVFTGAGNDIVDAFGAPPSTSDYFVALGNGYDTMVVLFAPTSVSNLRGGDPGDEAFPDDSIVTRASLLSLFDDIDISSLGFETISGPF